MRLNPKSPDYKRFISKIAFGEDDECWPWTGSLQNWGYGKIKIGHRIYAHRIAYETWVGEIPDGMLIRHTCDNPACCNPHHLLLGTTQDNVNDMVERGRNKHVVGENMWSAILTAEDAQEIYDTCALSNKSQTKIGELFGVKNQTVNDIWKGRTWAHSVNRWAH